MDSPATGSKLHAVLLSIPGMGHMIPNIELGKRLVTHHGFHVTVVVAGSASQPTAAKSKIIQDATSPSMFDIVQLPPVDISSLVGPDTKVITMLCVMMRESGPSFRAALSALALPPDVLILDLFSTEHLIVGDELGIPKFVYIASNAWYLAMMIYLPTLEKLVEGEFIEQPEPFKIPRCKELHPEDVIDPMLDRLSQDCAENSKIATELTMGDGILLNVWEDLQPKTLAALSDEKLLGQFARVSIYPTGPLIRPREPLNPNTEVFDWLDGQSNESVIYVSFGSGDTLSTDQLAELAWGLELSQQRFLWVFRPPTKKSGPGSYFDSGNGTTDMASFLPERYLEHTRGTVLIVHHWAHYKKFMFFRQKVARDYL